MKNASPANYVQLRRIVYCRVVLFNARRVNDPSRLKFSNIRQAFDNTWFNDEDIARLKPQEKKIVNKLYITFVPGKDNRKLVSVFIPKDLKPAIEKLCDIGLRAKVGISRKNDFVFAQTKSSGEPASGYHELALVQKELSSKSPITATAWRHYMSTKRATRFGGEGEDHSFFLHMGHDSEVNTHLPMSAGIKNIDRVGTLSPK